MFLVDSSLVLFRFLFVSLFVPYWAGSGSVLGFVSGLFLARFELDSSSLSAWSVLDLSGSFLARFWLVSGSILGLAGSGLGLAGSGWVWLGLAGSGWVWLGLAGPRLVSRLFWARV